jgi:hypothetical protein
MGCRSCVLPTGPGWRHAVVTARGGVGCCCGGRQGCACTGNSQGAAAGSQQGSLLQPPEADMVPVHHDAQYTYCLHGLFAGMQCMAPLAATQCLHHACPALPSTRSITCLPAYMPCPALPPCRPAWLSRNRAFTFHFPAISQQCLPT